MNITSVISPSNGRQVFFPPSMRTRVRQSQRALIAASLRAHVTTTTQHYAADLLHVSPHSVARAKKVLAAGVPKLLNAVACGRLGLADGATLAELSQEEQVEVLNRQTCEVRKAAVRRRSLKRARPSLTTSTVREMLNAMLAQWPRHGTTTLITSVREWACQMEADIHATDGNGDETGHDTQAAS